MTDTLFIDPRGAPTPRGVGPGPRLTRDSEGLDRLYLVTIQTDVSLPPMAKELRVRTADQVRLRALLDEIAFVAPPERSAQVA